MVAHFWWVTWAISSLCLEGMSKSYVFLNLKKQKKRKNTILFKFFWVNHYIVFCEQKRKMSNSLKITEWFAHLLFYAEQLEQIAHIRSFVMSGLSNLLTVAHLSWATWANRSHLLICLERFERFEWMSKFPTLNEQFAQKNDERIPNPAGKSQKIVEEDFPNGSIEDRIMQWHKFLCIWSKYHYNFIYQWVRSAPVWNNSFCKTSEGLQFRNNSSWKTNEVYQLANKIPVRPMKLPTWKHQFL